MKKSFLLFLFPLFVFLSAVEVLAENDKAFLWQVTSPEVSPVMTSVMSNPTTIYLMGSIHFADKSFYPLRPEIEQAFSQSKSLVVELDINKIDNNVYSQLVSQKGVYKESVTIQDNVSSETWRQLNQHLQSLDIDYESVKSYKPGILVLTLTATQIMKMGFNPQLGIDAYFLAKANQQSKRIIELETLEQQLDLFLNIPNAELLLKESLYSLNESEQLMADMVRYWKQGDVKQMNKLLFDDALEDYPAFSKIYDSLFYDRNYAMVKKIEKMFLQVQGDYFVIVGSGHLIGEQGIVNTLRKKGYKVQRL